ncbi:MAG: aldehyde dehydrogenase family protein, partial [Alphaproteobacteria bacterium]
MRKFQHYIDGRFEDGAASFESRDPATGEIWALMPDAKRDDTDRAVKAAHRAFTDPAWCDLTASQRGKLLYRLADLVAGNV